MSYKWTIGLIVASHLIVVGSAEAEKKHPLKCTPSTKLPALEVINLGSRANRFRVNNGTPVTWISRSSSWDAIKYEQRIQEYKEACWTEDVISSLFGYFDPDELIPVSMADKKGELFTVVTGTNGDEKKLKVKIQRVERLPWTRITQSERGAR